MQPQEATLGLWWSRGAGASPGQLQGQQAPLWPVQSIIWELCTHLTDTTAVLTSTAA